MNQREQSRAVPGFERAAFCGSLLAGDGSFARADPDRLQAGSYIPKPARSYGAFTLLEVLVAATVAVLIAGGALAVVSNALAWNNRVSGRQQARAGAMRVLDRVAADLAAISRQEGGTVGLAATIVDGVGDSSLWEAAATGQPAGRVSVGGDDFSAMRFGIGGLRLRFFAHVPGMGTEAVALPRAISYQIIRRTAPGTSGPRYWLHRAEVRAGESDGRPGSWESGWNLDPTAGGNFTHSSPGNDGSVAGDPFGVVRPEAAENLLAEGVVDFGVRWLESMGDGNWRVLFPATAGDRDYAAPKTDHYPQAADLFVRMLTPEGARRLAAFESNREDGADWWNVVAANSEVLTRRIHLPGGLR